jgi:hypothetical protein
MRYAPDLRTLQAKVGSGSAYRTVTLRHAGGTVALNPLTQEPTENG